jgi:hypothetical protein
MFEHSSGQFQVVHCLFIHEIPFSRFVSHRQALVAYLIREWTVLSIRSSILN